MEPVFVGTPWTNCEDERSEAHYDRWRRTFARLA